MPRTMVITSANSRFDRGPAAEVSMIPVFMRMRRVKFTGVIGTGLAQPKKGAPLVNPTMGISRVPIGSMCGRGLSVRRPCRAAVSSPSFMAVQAWKNSWTLSARIMGIRT